MLTKFDMGGADLHKQTNKKKSRPTSLFPRLASWHGQGQPYLYFLFQSPTPKNPDRKLANFLSKNG
jgi:hypothetical protein